MRKIVFALLFALCLVLPAAALADAFTFADLGATCEISSEKYTLITPENVAAQTEWLTAKGKTADEVLADFTARGVRLQAWTAGGDVCLEITAVQDAYASQYYDVNQITTDERKDYRVSHSYDKTGEWRALGYTYSSAAWNNYAKGGRFLQLEYTRTYNGQSYRGYARKTVRNGWHIQLDYQVYGRSLKSSDKSALETVMKTWNFYEVTKRPAGSTVTVAGNTAGTATAAVTKVIFTSTPPQETNTGKFTLSGTGTSGLRIVTVLMRMSSSEVTRFEGEITSKGKFSMDVQLPQEGYWQMTYLVMNGEEVVEEGHFEPITYDADMLTVALNAELPATMTLTGDKLVISGTTLKQTTVQCIVDGRNYTKSITTNNSGGFTFTIDTSAEGKYYITLSLTKKGYSTRRFTCEATRTYTDEERRANIRDEAIKPSYTTLTSKIASYMGRYMVYTVNIQSITPTTTGYLTFAGMTKTKDGVYKNMLVIRSDELPSYQADGSARVYLKCIGTYDVVGDGGSETYPYFDLEWVE